MVLWFHIIYVSSRRVALLISRPFSSSFSIVGSFESRMPIVFLSDFCLSWVFQFGTLVRMELYSSSIFILASNRALETSVVGVFFMESYIVFLIVFLMSLWYSAFL